MVSRPPLLTRRGLRRPEESLIVCCPMLRSILVVLFIGSGTSALIYELVWFQLLQLVIGSSAISLGVILATFMGGLCVGGLLLPRIIPAYRHPLRVLAVLEAGTAVLAILIVLRMPQLAMLYAGFGSHMLGTAMLCVICLLPPTLLMGATLPAIARWVDTTPCGMSWVGFFYGANIAGGVFGSLFAGFYLLRVFDMVVATYVAAGINVAVALSALACAGYVPAGFSKRSSAAVTDRRGSEERATRIVYAAIALSGFAALGAEVVWTRLLALVLGASVYTFSIILAVFLLGLGIGSSAGSVLARRVVHPREALAVCQFLAAGTIAWSAYMLTRQLPYWPVDATPALWLNFRLDLLRAALAVLPAACLWGSSFPLALAAVAGRSQDPGRLTSNVYAANTAGAIAGALGFSIAFVPFFGTQRAQQLLVGASAAAALLMLASADRKLRKPIPMRKAVALGAVVLSLLALSIGPIPTEVIGYGRFNSRTMAYRDPGTNQPFKPDFIYSSEGVNASVAVSQTPDGRRNFHVSGKIEASTEPRDMRLQRMLGHLPALSHPQPRSILVVGFGAGITSGTFVSYPGVERIVICEIEPLIPREVAKYFAAENYNVATDPRVEIVYDDARHFLLTTKEKFDVITSDPIHPWVKGAATLYSREYIEMARRHLNPGGVISQWVPLYQSTMEAVKSALATFFAVFPEATVWSNTVGGGGYDVVLVGQDSNRTLDFNELDVRLKRPDYTKVMQSLNDVGFASTLDLFAGFAGSSANLAPWLADAEINRDRNLRLQYLAGTGMNLDEGDAILASMLAYRRFPDRLFTGTEDHLQKLRSAIDSQSGRLITGTQAEAIKKVLNARPRRLSISAVKGNEEALRYATQLRHVIGSAGWEVDGINQSVFSERISGMLISVGADPPPAAANELFSALHAAGLSAEGSFNPNAVPGSVSLFVGEKP